MTSRSITRRILAVFGAALVLAFTAGAQAQDYPNRPVRIVVPYAAGGGVDAAARVLAQQLTAAMGQSFVVDPRPGGGTIIGADAVAKAAPDGYTLLLSGGSTMSLLPLTHPTKLPFDPINDYTPIGMVSRLPFFLVTAANQPYRGVRDLLDDAKGKSGTLSYASNGVGSMGHVGTEMLVQAAGAQMVHVPYNGFAPALSDLVTGRVSFVMADLAPLNALLQAKSLRPLAVASRQRSTFLPDVPTLAEAGYPNTDFEIWLALYAPAKTPRDIVAKLSAEVARWLATPAAKEAYAKLGHEADAGSGETVRQRILAEQKAFAPAAKAAGLGPK